MTISRTVLFLVLLVALTACAKQAVSTPITLPDIVAAFQSADLEAEDARPMVKDDYGAAPMVAAEAYRFLIPSLCEDCGGRLFRFEDTKSRDQLWAYYDELGKASALFFSWTYAEGLYLVQLNGDLPENTAQRYETVLKETVVTARNR